MPADTPRASDIPPSVELIALPRSGHWVCGWEGSADDQRFIRGFPRGDGVFCLVLLAIYVVSMLLTELFPSRSTAVLALIGMLGIFASLTTRQARRERLPFRPIRVGVDGVRIGRRFVAHDEILEMNVQDARVVLRTRGRPIKLVFRDAFGSKAFAEALESRARVRSKLLEERVISTGYREVRVEPVLESVKHALTEGTWEGSLPEHLREALVRI